MDTVKSNSKLSFNSSSYKKISDFFGKKSSQMIDDGNHELQGSVKKETPLAILEQSNMTPTSSSEYGGSKIKEEKTIEILDENMNVETEQPQEEKRFSLRKRRKINYNMKTGKFGYEDDSDYEEPAKYRGKKNKKKKQTSHGKTKTQAEKRLKDYSDPIECREFQLAGLLSWKANDPNGRSADDGESKYYELSSILDANFETYSESLQAILVNPPWSHTSPMFGINEFVKIKIPVKKMKEGLIFIWTEKEYIWDIVAYFESQGIKYVENVVWVRFDPEKKEDMSSTSDFFSLNNIFKEKEYLYFTQAHMTLLMFRKFLPSNKRYLELRHQRTGDAVFDYDTGEFPFYRPSLFAYKLIETLLPKALYKKGEPLKMMEIFSRENNDRKGWIHITQKQ